MKPLNIWAFLASAVVMTHAQQLPFVGKAYFNYGGTTGTQEYVSITNDGKIEVGDCNVRSCRARYKGAYSQYIDVVGTGYGLYTFTSTTVTTLDAKKNPDMNCDERGMSVEKGGHLPCALPLTFESKNGELIHATHIDEKLLSGYAYELMGQDVVTDKEGNKIWDSSKLTTKTNAKGLKIYCLSDKSNCKTEAEVVAFYESAKPKTTPPASTQNNWAGKYQCIMDEITIRPDMSFIYTVDAEQGESCEIKGELVSNENGELEFEDSTKACGFLFTKTTEENFYFFDVIGCKQYCTPNAIPTNCKFNKVE